jgi:hypothetical protein
VLVKTAAQAAVVDPATQAEQEHQAKVLLAALVMVVQGVAAVELLQLVKTPQQVMTVVLVVTVFFLQLLVQPHTILVVEVAADTQLLVVVV